MNLRLTRAIQQVLLAGGTAVFAAGVMADVGQQNPPPGPGMVPDYFGVVPNFANSPQPVLSTVTITDPNNAANFSAVAVATTYDYQLDMPTTGITDVQVLNGGSGYSTANLPTVTINSGNANATLAVATAIVQNGLIGSFTIVNGGANYSSLSTFVTISDSNGGTGSGATAIPLINAGVITGIQITNPGIGYTNPVVTIGTSNGILNPAIVITNPGSNYYVAGQPAPTVTITDATGQNGLATAVVDTDPLSGTFGQITGITLQNQGFGYSANPTITISGGSGFGATATITTLPAAAGGAGASATANVVNGVITGFNLNKNSANGVYSGEGYTVPMPGTGIRKFVDALPGLTLNGAAVSSYMGVATANGLGQSLPLAVADTTTFPGSDYFEIAEVQYTQQLHSDLPATTLRGYVQLVDPATPGAVKLNTVATTSDVAGKYSVMGKPNYLGPIITAMKDRPTRVKLVNLLPVGAAGKLPLPVDTTYMGADGAADTDNRTAMHLHGGNTPWISDGTARQWVKPAGEVLPNKGISADNVSANHSVPDMWFDASGALIANSPTCTQGTTTCTTANATNNPGDGSLTFYYTNQQSQRLMFYHDHAEGVTRLNVYDGLAGGYVLTDPTEQAMIAAGTLPGLADTIPLIIQEKTFVPNNTTPVLNFYGPFASQLQSQDPTWRWGTGAAEPVNTGNGNGDLWVPHVFMPNQNPGDISGANAMGRWDYGPWFWPPFTAIQNGPLDNPYFDPTCNTTTQYCEGPKIPGVPNGSLIANGGGVFDAKTNALTESPSATPEAFNDTPLVNGTAYPYINVDPKKYRLRILSVGNDRMLNMSLVVAATKQSDTTAAGNTSPANNAALCDGTNAAILPEDCTEVKMVPFMAAENKTRLFPSWWYTTQKNGVTFDGRPSGVFDPATRGPAMVQIGTEGGFLANPAVIRNQPVNYEYNPKNILIGNIKEHALLLGPAERADVIVDFSKYAGSTLILYNDAGAPVPAWDLRLDYYTGGYDTTDTGGAFSVVPGYGPNSRTLMQIRVSTNGVGANGAVVAANQTTSRDYVDSTAVTVDANNNVTGGSLATAVRTAFKTSQEPIVVPQSTYNAAYGTNVADAIGGDLSGIGSTALTFRPLSENPAGYATGQVETTALTLEMQPKTIIEDWTMNWGRMNALLGTEVPRTNATIQTSIPQAFVDPPTEIVKISPNNGTPVGGTLADGTQLWKVTHNGVDSHSIHFHLFHVQLVNRVGWDGAIYPPAANELGWKDSVLMHPLSDVIVALRPKTMDLPFKVGNSHHLMDPKQADGFTPPAAGAGFSDFFNLNPQDGNGAALVNSNLNYGWEYLWHCHILGHEENDMMRSIATAVSPNDPIGLTVTRVNATTMKLDWMDDSMNANWFSIERTVNGVVTSIPVAFTECNLQAGCARTYNDVVPAFTAVQYRVVSHNTVGAGELRLDGAGNLPLAGLTPNATGYTNVTADSAYTAPANFVPASSASAAPSPLAFGNQTINVASAAKVVTVTNAAAATGNLTFPAVAVPTGANAADFSVTANTCAGNIAPAASCTISVVFKPTAAVVAPGTAETATLTIATNDPANPTLSVGLTGNSVMPVAVLPATPLAFGSLNVGASSAVQTVTLSNTGTGPLTINSITASAQFAQTNSCGASLAAGANCAINVTFVPTTAGAAPGTLTVNDNSNGVASMQTVSLSGTGVAVVPVVPTVPSVVRDNFNRTNANTLVTGWQQNVTGGLAVLRVNANQATANLLGASGYAYNNTVGGATQGAGFTFANTTVNNTALFLKASGTLGGAIGSNQLQNAVRVLYNGGNVIVSTTTNGNAIAPTYTAVGAAISTGGALVNGNSLLAAVDNTGKVWVWKKVGATTTLLTPTGVQLPNNALWTTGGGKVGMQLPNGARVDNFVAY